MPRTKSREAWSWVIPDLPIQEADPMPFYQFFTLEGEQITEPKQFLCDKAAVDWLRENHPEYSSTGVEMWSWW